MAEPTATSSRRSRSNPGHRRDAATDADWLADIAGLSFQEARTALELAMAQLQSEELEVEEMAGLYRRAEAYANRCEALLRQVEQDVIEWESDDPPASR